MLVCLVAGLTVCIAAENLRRVLAQTLVIVGNCRAQRFLCQHGAVHLYRRQTVQSLSNGLVGQLERFLQALALYHLGSQLGTTGMFLSEDIEGVTAQTYNRAIDAVNDLVNGRVDAVIIDKNPAEVFNTKFEGKVKIIDGAEFGFETEEYAIALPKGSELVEQVNQALADLKADGTFDALVAQYIGE